ELLIPPTIEDDDGVHMKKMNVIVAITMSFNMVIYRYARRFKDDIHMYTHMQRSIQEKQTCLNAFEESFYKSEEQTLEAVGRL
ncbi:hypothetical protein A2U01_0030128, partial [Trifolium medium]|nr:hypothetical protein [Trifolium medium]